MSPSQWNYPNNINTGVHQRGVIQAREALAEATLRHALAEIRLLQALAVPPPATQSQEVSNG
jgi:hypothetical protein